MIKGVPAELSWQRIFNEPNDRPHRSIKISATLDELAREALGLKVSHLVRGAVPATDVGRMVCRLPERSMQAE